LSVALDPSLATENAEFTVNRTWRSDRSTPARWLWSHGRRHAFHIVGIILGALGNAGGGALLPVFVGQAFNAINRPQPDLNAIVLPVILILVSQIVRGVIQVWRNFSSEVIGQRLERDIRDELYASLIGKSMAFHDRQRIGDVMARATNDVREINFLMNPGVNIVIGSGSFLIFPIVFAALLEPQLMLVPILFVLGYALAVRHFLVRLAPATEQVRATFGVMNATLAEALEGVETVKGAAQEPREITRFGERLSAWKAAAIRQGDVEAIYLPGLVLGVTIALGVLHSLYLHALGTITLGDVVAYNGLLLFLRFPTFATQFAYPQVSSGYASARRILELINTETDLDQNATGFASDMRGDVRFDGVTFGYAGATGRAAVRNIQLHVPAGKTVAIVGQTGSGKSTLTKLINRIYDVDTGAVSVDGVDVRQWDLAALRRQISYIEQDIFLFSRTIAENIAFGAPNATREQIEYAARAAQAHTFITQFKDGYDTMVGERGVTLSGGQRQRIAIARAFLTNPRILILDDSTSAIDSATEDEIQRAMFDVARGRTTFVITHRLSQIRWADMIVVLKGGAVETFGDHETVMANSPTYRAIFDPDNNARRVTGGTN
jgi:ATP-binding cassette, subfamily B, bacterial